MAVFAPIPSASVTIATAVNPGFFLSVRAPYRISCRRFSMEVRFRKNQAPRVLRLSDAEPVFHFDVQLRGKDIQRRTSRRGGAVQALLNAMLVQKSEYVI